jgi:uncharacterized tellurite resistance protein B-like protein
MNTISFDKLLLTTAFCCMASDGHIDKREIALLKAMCEKSPLFQDFSFEEEINLMVNEINLQGKEFIKCYFDLLDKSELTKIEELTLIDFAIQIIKADEHVEYSEIKFFKNIRHRLEVNDATILEAYPDIESFLEPDIGTDTSLEKITHDYLESANMPTFELISISPDITLSTE